MTNAWNVIYWRDGKKFIRVFEGDSPRDSGAIDFGKRLKAKGLTHVFVTSRRKGFAPPPTKRAPPTPGMLWCPYCLAWREFIETSITHNGLRGPINWRCPICTISIHDYHVRMNNEMMVARLDHRAELKAKVPSEKQIKQAVNSRRR